MKKLSGQTLGSHLPAWRRWLITAVILLTLAGCGNERVTLDDPNIILIDEFKAGETNEWVLEGDSDGKSTILNERLVIELEAAHLMQYAVLSEPHLSDFILEVDVLQLAGNLESSYGVLFRMQSPEQFYRFDITGSGLYILERHNADGSWTRYFEDWIESDAVKTGLAVTNRLKIAALGPDLSFYINDQLVQQVNDGSYTSGQIAMDAGTFGYTGLQVAFDNLVVRQP